MAPKYLPTIRIERAAATAVVRSTRSTRSIAAVLAVAALVFGLVATTASASADDVVGTVNVAAPPIRSLTVDPHAVDFICSAPSGELTFPNDTCALDVAVNQGGIVVTNGAAPSTITVGATDFVAAGASGPTPPSWDLVAPSCWNGTFSDGSVCAGDGPAPSTDQAELSYFSALNGVNFLKDITNAAHPLTTPAHGTGQFAPAAATWVPLHLVGPSSSTDASTSWLTTITFTADPPA